MTDKEADGGPTWLAIVGNNGSNLGMARILALILLFVTVTGVSFAIIS